MEGSMNEVNIKLSLDEAEQIARVMDLRMEDVRDMRLKYGDKHTKIVMKDFLGGISRFCSQYFLQKRERSERIKKSQEDFMKKVKEYYEKETTKSK